MLKRQNASLINPPSKKGGKIEKKNLDVNQAATIVFNQTTATVALLNGVAQGYSELQHIGRSLTMSSIQWRFTGHLAPTTTGASAIRLLIVYDRQTNAALPATTAVVVADSIEHPMNLANGKRFLIICDEEFTLGTAGPQSFHLKGYKKLNLPVEFGGNGAAVSSIATGGIYSFVWQDGGLLVASPVTQLYTRIRFSDD